MNHVKIAPVIIVSLAFVMMREAREQVTHVLQLLMKLFTRITLEDEWNMRAYDYITKAQRVMKIFQGKFRDAEDFKLLQSYL